MFLCSLRSWSSSDYHSLSWMAQQSRDSRPKHDSLKLQTCETRLNLWSTGRKSDEMLFIILSTWSRWDLEGSAERTEGLSRENGPNRPQIPNPFFVSRALADSTSHGNIFRASAENNDERIDSTSIPKHFHSENKRGLSCTKRISMSAEETLPL